VRVLNNPVPAPFKESIRCAEQNLYARAPCSWSATATRASHEFSVQLRGFDAAKSGCQDRRGALIALSSALLRKSVRGGLVVVGEVTLGGTIEPDPQRGDLAEMALRKEPSRCCCPCPAAQLFDLSDDMATKLDIEFYQDAKVATFRISGN
jgi:ATP-dependent Lon protease